MATHLYSKFGSICVGEGYFGDIYMTYKKKKTNMWIQIMGKWGQMKYLEKKKFDSNSTVVVALWKKNKIKHISRLKSSYVGSKKCLVSFTRVLMFFAEYTCPDSSVSFFFSREALLLVWYSNLFFWFTRKSVIFF